jgi:hypothetical protein
MTPRIAPKFAEFIETATTLLIAGGIAALAISATLQF